MRAMVLGVTLALGTACHSSTSPTHNLHADSLSVNGSWTGLDSVSDTIMLSLTQTGDSVRGTGRVASVDTLTITRRPH